MYWIMVVLQILIAFISYYGLEKSIIRVMKQLVKERTSRIEGRVIWNRKRKR